MYEHANLGDLGFGFKISAPKITIGSKPLAPIANVATQALKPVTQAVVKPIIKATQSIGAAIEKKAIRPVVKLVAPALPILATPLVVGAAATGLVLNAVGANSVAAPLLSVIPGASGQAQSAQNPSDWMVYQYIDDKGQFIDAYGNVSPNPPVAGKVYYDLNGNPVDYQKNPIASDAKGISLIQKGDKYYLLSNPNQEMIIGDDGNAYTVADYRAKYQPDWGKYEYFDANGKLTDAYGNPSPNPPVAGTVYYDAQGNAVDYQMNAIAVDAKGTQIIQKGGKYYDFKTGAEVMIDDSGNAVSPSQYAASKPGWGVYEYLDANGKLIDAYGNASPNPPIAGNVYYDANGNPVDFMSNPILVDSTGKQIVQYQGRYFDLKNFNELWIDQNTNAAISPESWIAKYAPNGNVVSASGTMQPNGTVAY